MVHTGALSLEERHRDRLANCVVTATLVGGWVEEAPNSLVERLVERGGNKGGDLLHEALFRSHGHRRPTLRERLPFKLCHEKLFIAERVVPRGVVSSHVGDGQGSVLFNPIKRRYFALCPSSETDG